MKEITNAQSISKTNHKAFIYVIKPYTKQSSLPRTGILSVSVKDRGPK